MNPEAAPVSFSPDFDGFGVLEGFVLVVLIAFAMSVVYIWNHYRHGNDDSDK